MADRISSSHLESLQSYDEITESDGVPGSFQKSMDVDEVATSFYVDLDDPTSSEEAKLGKRPPSDVGSTQNRANDQKENNNGVSKSSATTSNKKPRRLSSDESNGNEFTSTMPQKKGNPENNPKESKGLPAAQSDEKGSSQLLGKGLSWKQRSSWKDLVGETVNSLFNISYILPNASLKKDTLKFNGFDTDITNDNKCQKVKKRVRFESTHTEPLGLPKDEILQDNVCMDGPSSDTQNLVKQGSCETAGSEPLGLIKDEILLDKVSTDSPSTGPQKLMNQKRGEFVGSEHVALVKVEIIQDKLSTDSPSIAVQSETPSKESEPLEEVQFTEPKAGNSYTCTLDIIHVAAEMALVAKAHQDVIQKLVDLIGITSIMEVLVRLVEADDHVYSNFTDVMQWLANSNLLGMIVDKLNPSLVGRNMIDFSWDV